MGLGDPQLLGDGGGVGSAAAVSCSICLESVVDSGERSTARLQCGHLFHLDCVGSAFNAKGVMQCPNCRKIEKGNWFYSNGHSISEILDEWMHEDDFFDMTYPEVPFGVHFCPFSRLSRFPFSYEEGEYTSSLGYTDLSGRHTIFTEYPGPHVSSESAAIDALNFHHPWNNIPGPVDVPNSHTFPVPDVHRQTWDSHTQPSNHVSDFEQASTSTARAVRIGSDVHPRQMHVPLAIGQGSGSRANNSTTTSMVPHHVGNSRAQSRRERHPLRTHGVANYFPDAQQFGSSWSLASRGLAPHAEQRSVYYLHPTASSTRNPQDTQPISGGSNQYVWERDRLAAPFPSSTINRNFPLPQTNASQDFGGRTVFRPERPALQRPPPHHRHPFT